MEIQQLYELGCAFDLGEHDAVLAGLPALVPTFESSGRTVGLIDLRSYGVRVSTLRGGPVDAATLAWIVGAVRESNHPASLSGLAATVPAHLLRGDRDIARALLVELDSQMAASADWQPPQIASLVRASLELDEPGLAESILGGFPARNRYAQNAAVAAKAAIHEARGDLAAAIEGYGDAAERWSSFEVVPELAFALLGQGRSLVASGRAADAAEPLARARSIFERLKAAPALAEIAALSSSV